ncbi:hypothetical protein LVB87_06470 [Lysobacter sp. KIS68-7]|uniref:hypothetical protein n=1 Tax=Lysobacter sp. KIS68-7 TaxID=2904252 RepID=UPI001E4DCCA1|nr:hypothetical protein [Lysobacter sp. KIS68-7]UHQ20781.1 hypothetical protein LVB87_06470 [Lysobacter sp. KIS68-7]
MQARTLFRAHHRNLARVRNAKRAALAVLLVGVLIGVPAASETAKGPKTQLWLDVATHAMPGMPNMTSGMGGAAMRMFGGEQMQNHYGAAHYPGLPGRYVDIALLNQLNPGKEAEDLVPAGLQLGKTLPLVPPKSPERAQPGGKTPYGNADGNAKARILIYWGCGLDVRAGQPREIKFEVKNGKLVGDTSKWGSTMQGRYAPDRTVDVGPSYALWPNEKHRKMVPDNGSLVGAHKIEGEQIPASMQFDLTQMQDFMPKIALTSSGSLESGQTWKWQSVDRAKGYFLAAMGMQGDALVLWSSSETGDAGMGVMDYLPPSTVDKWIKDKVVLAPSVTSCAIPKGIFAATNGQAAGGMLQMIAFGPESNIVYPPKPADPKVAWNPEWNVRVRNKSTATAMLGLDMGAMQQQEAQDPAQPQQPQESKAKKLLRGILGH